MFKFVTIIPLEIWALVPLLFLIWVALGLPGFVAAVLMFMILGAAL